MNDALRFAAVAAAVALVAAPYWPAIKAGASRALEAGKAKAGLIGRLAAAGLLLAAVWGKVPLPAMPSPVAPVAVETPSESMQTTVKPIADALASLGPVDRALWASTWNKAALVVAGDAVATEVAFTDTRSLRLFTTLAIDIAWRRIGRHVPGSNEPLRKAVEDAYASAIGASVQPVDKSVRDRYVEFARAVAWAGMNGG